jgi:hypothetical protein
VLARCDDLAARNAALLLAAQQAPTLPPAVAHGPLAPAQNLALAQSLALQPQPALAALSAGIGITEWDGMCAVLCQSGPVSATSFASIECLLSRT